MSIRHESVIAHCQLTEVLATEAPKIDALRAAGFTTDAGNRKLPSYSVAHTKHVRNLNLDSSDTPTASD